MSVSMWISWKDLCGNCSHNWNTSFSPWFRLILNSNTGPAAVHLQSRGPVVALVWNAHWLKSSHAGLGSSRAPQRERRSPASRPTKHRDVMQGKYQRETIVWTWILYLQIILELGTTAELWHISPLLSPLVTQITSGNLILMIVP